MIRSPTQAHHVVLASLPCVSMDAASRRRDEEKWIRLNNWFQQPEELYAKRMRTLRQLCVESDTVRCRDQFFGVLMQMDDWEFEDVDIQDLVPEKGNGKRPRLDVSGPLDKVALRQSPPPGKAAAGLAAAAAPGPACPATGWPTILNDPIEQVFKDEAQQKAETIERNRASAMALRAAKIAAEQQSKVTQAVKASEVFPFRAASGSWL